MEKGRAAKKEQQKSKKKRNNENRFNASDTPYVNNNPSRSKKAKKNKVNEGEKTSIKKQSSAFMFIFTPVIIIAVVIAFLYLVDYEKFTKVKLAANASLNKTLGLLPPKVVTKGRETFEFIYPSAEIVFNQVSTIISRVSTFLNTNPIIRDHWVIAREISLVCGGLFVDYMRTLYLLTCWCCSKLLPTN